MAKQTRQKLTKQQEEEIISMLYWGYPKTLIKQHFKSRFDIDLKDNVYKLWKTRVEKEAKERASEAIKRWEERVFEKYLSQREVRIHVLMERFDQASQFEIDPGDHLAFQRINREIRETLKQIAQELQEWRTGDTVNVVYNIIAPALESVAYVLLRHVPEGDARSAAVDELRRVSKSYFEGLPDAKVIPAKAK